MDAGVLLQPLADMCHQFGVVTVVTHVGGKAVALQQGGVERGQQAAVDIAAGQIDEAGGYGGFGMQDFGFLGHKAAAPPVGGDDAGIAQLFVGGGYGVGVDAQFVGKRAHGGQAVAGGPAFVADELLNG